MLHLAKLQVSRGDFTAELSSLRIAPGQCVALCGVSGSGKSTLLEAIGLLTSGFKVLRFEFGGIAVDKLSYDQQQILRVAKMGIMPQVGGMLPFLTVAENWQMQIKLALRQNLSKLPPFKLPQATGGEQSSPLNAKQLYERLLPLAERLDLAQHVHKLPEQLSIGQRQRALFLRAIAHDPQLLLIDEPTSSLDPDNALVLFKLIEEIAHDSHMGVLIVTHDLDSVAAYPQYVYQPDRSHGGYAYFGTKGE